MLNKYYLDGYFGVPHHTNSIKTYLGSLLMVHDLNQKNLHINGLFFLQNPKKKTILGMFFGHYPQNEIFSQKYDSFSFLPFRLFNFLSSFEKSYKSFWRKCIYLLKYWHNESGEIIGTLFT